MTLESLRRLSAKTIRADGLLHISSNIQSVRWLNNSVWVQTVMKTLCCLMWVAQLQNAVVLAYSFWVHIPVHHVKLYSRCITCKERLCSYWLLLSCLFFSQGPATLSWPEYCEISGRQLWDQLTKLSDC